MQICTILSFPGSRSPTDVVPGKEKRRSVFRPWAPSLPQAGCLRAPGAGASQPAASLWGREAAEAASGNMRVPAGHPPLGERGRRGCLRPAMGLGPGSGRSRWPPMGTGHEPLPSQTAPPPRGRRPCRGSGAWGRQTPRRGRGRQGWLGAAAWLCLRRAGRSHPQCVAADRGADWAWAWPSEGRRGGSPSMVPVSAMELGKISDWRWGRYESRQLP